MTVAKPIISSSVFRCVHLILTFEIKELRSASLVLPWERSPKRPRLQKIGKMKNNYKKPFNQSSKRPHWKQHQGINYRCKNHLGHKNLEPILLMMK
jgi:hypothetical protein